LEPAKTTGSKMENSEFENVLSRAVEDRFERLIQSEPRGDVRDRIVVEMAKAEAMTHRVTLEDAVDVIVWEFIKKAGRRA
jgi:hypothetical protein